MSIDLKRAIDNSVKYSINLKNFGLAYAYSLFFGLAMLALLAMGGADLERFPTGAVSAFQSQPIPLVAVILLTVIVGVYLPVLFILNYANKGTLKKTMQAITAGLVGKYVLALLLVGIISSLLGEIPLIGFILSFIIALMFYFVEQEVVIRKTGIIDSLKKSYNIFNKNKLDVLVACLAVGVITAIVALVFAVPLLMTIWPFVSALMQFAAIESPDALPALPTFNVYELVLPGLIALVGLTFVYLLGIAFKTDVYQQLTKGKKK